MLSWIKALGRFIIQQTMVFVVKIFTERYKVFMKCSNILSWFLLVLAWFIAIATCTYFVLAYGWEFMVWVFAMAGLIVLALLATYNGVKRR